MSTGPAFAAARRVAGRSGDGSRRLRHFRAMLRRVAPGGPAAGERNNAACRNGHGTARALKSFPARAQAT